MERLITWWTYNRIAANLLMVGILLAGFFGFRIMERETFPVFAPNQVQIEVEWLGAVPQEVEEQVLIRIEAALKNLDNIRRIYATATEGFGRMEILTYPTVDIEDFLNQVKGAIDAVNSLPEGMEKPGYKGRFFVMK